jgi:hypothetical protein
MLAVSRLRAAAAPGSCGPARAAEHPSQYGYEPALAFRAMALWERLPRAAVVEVVPLAWQHYPAQLPEPAAVSWLGWKRFEGSDAGARLDGTSNSFRPQSRKARSPRSTIRATDPEPKPTCAPPPPSMPVKLRSSPACNKSCSHGRSPVHASGVNHRAEMPLLFFPESSRNRSNNDAETK